MHSKETKYMHTIIGASINIVYSNTRGGGETSYSSTRHSAHFNSIRHTPQTIQIDYFPRSALGYR